MDEQRELNFWSKLLLDVTKETIENNSNAVKQIFRQLTRESWKLNTFQKNLASTKAYNEFYDLTGQDIRNFNWTSKVKTKQGETKRVEKMFKFEHLTTASDFQKELIHLYRSNLLTIEKIKELLQTQQICWITIEEDKELNKKYLKHRPNPLQAYKECNIDIYQLENVNPEKIMKPTFKRKTNDEIFFKIQKELNKIKAKYKFKVTKNSHATIYNKNNCYLHLRVKEGALKDICIYINGEKAKKTFNKIKLNKTQIETTLGYNLNWDENKKKKATRIGRFFKGAEINTPFEFDYNVNENDYEKKVVKEIENFYKVFTPIIENL